MAMLLSRQYQTRRLALVVVIFIVIYLLLRSPSKPAGDYHHALNTPPDSKDASTNKDKSSDSDASDSGGQDPQSVERPRDRITKELQKMLAWIPPAIKDHYPPYGDYEHRDYDPNRWEAFEQYGHGTRSVTLG